MAERCWAGFVLASATDLSLCKTNAVPKTANPDNPGRNHPDTWAAHAAFHRSTRSKKDNQFQQRNIQDYRAMGWKVQWVRWLFPPAYNFNNSKNLSNFLSPLHCLTTESCCMSITCVEEWFVFPTPCRQEINHWMSAWDWDVDCIHAQKKHHVAIWSLHDGSDILQHNVYCRSPKPMPNRAWKNTMLKPYTKYTNIWYICSFPP